MNYLLIFDNSGQTYRLKTRLANVIEEAKRLVDIGIHANNWGIQRENADGSYTTVAQSE